MAATASYCQCVLLPAKNSCCSPVHRFTAAARVTPPSGPIGLPESQQSRQRTCTGIATITASHQHQGERAISLWEGRVPNLQIVARLAACEQARSSLLQLGRHWYQCGSLQCTMEPKQLSATTTQWPHAVWMVRVYMTSLDWSTGSSSAMQCQHQRQWRVQGRYLNVLAGQRSEVARRHTNTATHLADPTPSILSNCE